MNTALVIGYGNTLRSDDGAGVRAAEGIARQFPEADIVTAQALHPELAERMSRRELVIFLDASVRTPGLRVTALTPAQAFVPTDGHTLTPGGLLSLCLTLYDTVPRDALLIEIPAFHCGFGETMTARTAQMADCSTRIVSELLLGQTTIDILLLMSSAPAA